MGLLPVNFQLATPFQSRLGGQAWDRQTDGQTDRHQCIIFALYGRGAL